MRVKKVTVQQKVPSVPALHPCQETFLGQEEMSSVSDPPGTETVQEIQKRNRKVKQSDLSGNESQTEYYRKTLQRSKNLIH